MKILLSLCSALFFSSCALHQSYKSPIDGDVAYMMGVLPANEYQGLMIDTLGEDGCISPYRRKPVIAESLTENKGLILPANVDMAFNYYLVFGERFCKIQGVFRLEKDHTYFFRSKSTHGYYCDVSIYTLEGSNKGKAIKIIPLKNGIGKSCIVEPSKALSGLEIEKG